MTSCVWHKVHHTIQNHRYAQRLTHAHQVRQCGNPKDHAHAGLQTLLFGNAVPSPRMFRRSHHRYMTAARRVVWLWNPSGGIRRRKGKAFPRGKRNSNPGSARSRVPIPDADSSLLDTWAMGALLWAVHKIVAKFRQIGENLIN